MAKILFLNPVIRQNDSPRHIPYGMALLAAIADKAGHQVQFFDANAWRLEDDVLRSVLTSDNWDIVAMGGISTTYGWIKQTLRYAKKYAPKSLLVVGGGVLTSMPQDLMRLLPEIDIGVVGEGVATLPEVLKKTDEGKSDWALVPGIIWRDSGGISHLNPPRPLVDDMDQLPYPAWEMLPMDIYFQNSGLLYSEESFTAKRRMDLNGSLGCPFICRFCFHLGLAGDLQNDDSKNDQGDVVFTHDRVNRMHSPRYIVNMAKHMHQKYGADFIFFLDENLLAMNSVSKNKWLPELSELWIKEGLQPQCIRDCVQHDPDKCKGVHWGGTSHAGLVNLELLKKMHNAGCAQLTYGYESFSKRVLKSVGKGATPESNERSLIWTLEAGIRPVPNQMFGFPDDFFDSIYDCIEAWERLGIQVMPFFATPYPGTEWYNKYKDKILSQYDGDLEAFLLDLGDATKISAVICENFNAVELLGLRQLMVDRDVRRIKKYEEIWRQMHGEPAFSDVRWPQAKKRIMLSVSK